jgi:hypothetical protein
MPLITRKPPCGIKPHIKQQCGQKHYLQTCKSLLTKMKYVLLSITYGINVVVFCGESAPLNRTGCCTLQ